MTKPMGTRDLIDAIAKIDDRLIDLLADAEARSYGAVSGDQADIAALEENRHQRQELEARRTILEQAKAQAARNEAADQEAAAAERVRQHEQSIRQMARKLRTRAIRVDAMRDEFAAIVSGMVELEKDIRTHCVRIDVSFSGRTGQGELAANAIARMGSVNQPRAQTRSITELVDVAWGPYLADEGKSHV